MHLFLSSINSNSCHVLISIFVSVDMVHEKCIYLPLNLSEQISSYAAFLNIKKQQYLHQDNEYCNMLYITFFILQALEHILKSLKLCSSSDVSCAQLHVDHGDILKDMKQWDDAAQVLWLSWFNFVMLS